MNETLKRYFDIDLLSRNTPYIHSDGTVCIVKQFNGENYFNCDKVHEMRCSELQGKPGEAS
jgi:hypothetical protein